MAVTQKRLLQDYGTGGLTFTATKKTIVTSIYVLSRHTSSGLLDIQIVPTGQFVNPLFAVYQAQNLEANGTFSLSNLDWVLDVGDKIVTQFGYPYNLIIFGVEIT